MFGEVSWTMINPLMQRAGRRIRNVRLHASMLWGFQIADFRLRISDWTYEAARYEASSAQSFS